MAIKEITIPDIGTTNEVDVIDVMVKPGDKVAKEASLITLEGDKATMDIPSPFAGTIKELKIKKGDKVGQGSVIMTVETTAEKSLTDVQAEKPTKQENKSIADSSTLQEVRVPDIGTASKVDVIDILVKAGDTVAKDVSLITLEGDKATMDIPSPIAGKIKEIKMKKGDKVAQNDLILFMETTETTPAKTEGKPADTSQSAAAEKSPANIQNDKAAATYTQISDDIHAGPATRRIAREFGIDLTQVKGSGPKNRIIKTDLQNYVKTSLAQVKNGAIGGGLNLAPAPTIDFAKYGNIEIKPLNKIKRLTGANVHRSWVTIPHVTQFGEADITELEEFRKQQKEFAEKNGVKLTPLVFIMKACVAALRALPTFNSSLDTNGENLIMKNYYHIGVAVDTPNGLVVPVIHDVDKKSLFELAKELAVISVKAREKGLSIAEMEGSTFTISSLGGIGGTAFTPIVKSPDVAILGVSKSSIKPVYQNKEFVPRLMLPLSLSYDHRVIDGAEGARFMVYLENYLADIRTLLL